MRFLILPALLLSTAAFAAEGEAKAKPYTLDTCATSGEKLGGMGEPIVKTYNGQEIKFCCKGCIKKFEKDVDGNVAKVQKQIADQAKADAAGDTKAKKGLDRGM